MKKKVCGIQSYCSDIPYFKKNRNKICTQLKKFKVQKAYDEI